jgi:hypothetical protein
MALLEVDHAQGSGAALCRCGPRHHPLIGNVDSSQGRGVVSHLELLEQTTTRVVARNGDFGGSKIPDSPNSIVAAQLGVKSL